jgi:hypothetical protein
MTDATNSQPGLDPDRASFTAALHAARDQVVQAVGVLADTVIDLVGKIGRAVLDNLLPDRRPRLNARTVKRAISKYNAPRPEHRPAHLQGNPRHPRPYRTGLDNRPATLRARRSLTRGLGVRWDADAFCQGSVNDLVCEPPARLVGYWLVIRSP